MSSCPHLRGRRSALPQLGAQMRDAVVSGCRFPRCSASFRKRPLMLTLFARWQGGASFASFTCGAVLEGLQCDFLLLAYWTQLMALNDEGRYTGWQLLHILSHSVYPILQTMLASLWFGSRCDLPLTAPPIPQCSVPRTHLQCDHRRSAIAGRPSPISNILTR
jgi:hypothetical protein